MIVTCPQNMKQNKYVADLKWFSGSRSDSDHSDFYDRFKSKIDH